MKKALFACAAAVTIIGSANTSNAYVNYPGQAQMTRMYVGDNLWRLDCLASSASCATVNFAAGTITIYSPIINAVIVPGPHEGTVPTEGHAIPGEEPEILTTIEDITLNP